MGIDEKRLKLRRYFGCARRRCTRSKSSVKRKPAVYLLFEFRRAKVFFGRHSEKNVMTPPRHNRVIHLSNVAKNSEKPELLPETATRTINMDKRISHTHARAMVLLSSGGREPTSIPLLSFTMYIPRIGEYEFRARSTHFRFYFSWIYIVKRDCARRSNPRCPFRFSIIRTIIKILWKHVRYGIALRRWALGTLFFSNALNRAFERRKKSPGERRSP